MSLRSSSRSKWERRLSRSRAFWPQVALSGKDHVPDADQIPLDLPTGSDALDLERGVLVHQVVLATLERAFHLFARDVGGELYAGELELELVGVWSPGAKPLRR